MLKELTLTNFKSFAGNPQTIPFAPVTVFVGANASGKSNAFDAIRVLNGIGEDLTIEECFEGPMSSGAPAGAGIRGGLRGSFGGPGETMEIVTTLEVDNEHRRPVVEALGSKKRLPRRRSRSGIVFLPMQRRLVHRLRVAVVSQPRIVSESVETDEEGILLDFDGDTLMVLGKSGELEHCGTMSLEGGIATDTDYIDLHASLAGEVNGLENVHKYARVWSDAMLRSYRDLIAYDFSPSMMRSYVSAGIDELGTRGEFLSAAMFNLCAEERNKELILEWLSFVIAPQVSDIVFDQTDLGYVMLAVIEDGGGRPQRIPAACLSDGTLRLLATIALILNAESHSTLLLEEVDNGLHPTRIHLLVELLEQFAAERNIQIVATTHNPQVLHSLSEQALRDVVLFARTEDYPGTVVRRLGDLPHFEEVTQKARIDELFANGWMEFAV